MKPRVWLLLPVALALLAACTAPIGPASSPAAAVPTPLRPAESAADAATMPTLTPIAEASTAAEPEMTPVPCNGVLTAADQEGPYYTPGSPERASLMEEGMAGVPILVFGHVFDPECKPVAGAKVDFWQADAAGVYDNMGYTLRGHVLTDENGAYALESIEPGVYPGRPPHVHVKVFAPDGRELLTTQMYFTGSEGSGEVRRAAGLLVPYLGLDDAGRQQVRFDFVVDASGG